jgi:hypothetical protein
MNRLRRNVITGIVAMLAVVGAAFAVSTTSAQTQAAWTDRSYSKAAVTAGTWNTPPVGNTCTAVNQAGAAVACAVSSVYYDGWGTAGNQIRNYYVVFNAPGAKSISFSVDLTTATGAGGSWSWTNAGVSSSAQFTPTGGWTCGSLPRVTGKAFDWYSTVFFPVYENKTGQSVMCS